MHSVDASSISKVFALMRLDHVFRAWLELVSRSRASLRELSRDSEFQTSADPFSFRLSWGPLRGNFFPLVYDGDSFQTGGNE